MSFCEISNTLPSGSCAEMPAKGRLEGRFAHCTSGKALSRDSAVSTSFTSKPKCSRRARRLEAEHGFVKARAHRVVFADDGEVIELGEHETASGPGDRNARWADYPPRRCGAQTV